ncbi:hypothetical protein KE3_1984 [Streptococcus lutetiensis 033]|uniref:Uncharacterized protein n=1 Tax=Streptococcus lutetiensis 033 TaxID=1076934 RepID=A0AB33APB9_9STRE|nr:hypothetical protein KE3_1984 [Streptococcus lutetiensis 033]
MKYINTYILFLYEVSSNKKPKSYTGYCVISSSSLKFKKEIIMDIRETLNRQDYTKLDEFSKQLEGFERIFADKNLLEMR